MGSKFRQCSMKWSASSQGLPHEHEGSMCKFARRPVFGRNARICLLCLMIIGIFSLCFPLYKPLTISGVVEYTHLNDKRQPKQVFIRPKLKCKENSMKNTVVMVLNKASSLLRREAIRETWGHPAIQAKYNFSLYFVIGNERNSDLTETDVRYGDILHVDVNENYFNITEKVIEAMNWATHACPESSFFFKIDDDVYFNVEFLREIQNDEKYVPDNVILGDCLPETKPYRMTSKFRVSYDQYPFQFYPPYCGGPGYVMTLNTARNIYSEMLNTKTFEFEDVYVGIAAYKLGITVKNVEYFIYAMDNYIHDFYINCAMITHNLTPEYIRKLWKDRHRRNNVECSLLGKWKTLVMSSFQRN
ncbi:beta-1,3-galactosyltransferase 5-like [Ylistrum balloti]|uniref:beta-1,3-galactosyltransferase 5-like n=1 Tax=Ylistrum balloti TaxID=509963 RepID=UPI002905B90D|nr:beta-1,3-galactosyltransferase 5-like [Ylistrum balloti]